MKTIFVVFAEEKAIFYQKKRHLTPEEIAERKPYAYNTNADLKEGDLLNPKMGTHLLQVVRVMDEYFTWYNTKSDELKMVKESKLDKPILSIEIVKSVNALHCEIIK